MSQATDNIICSIQDNLLTTEQLIVLSDVVEAFKAANRKLHELNAIKTKALQLRSAADTFLKEEPLTL